MNDLRRSRFNMLPFPWLMTTVVKEELTGYRQIMGSQNLAGPCSFLELMGSELSPAQCHT